MKYALSLITSAIVISNPLLSEAKTEFKDCPECPIMLEIPAGDFSMGSPETEERRFDNEGPRHKVAITTSFAVGKYEVTFDEWDACYESGGCRHLPKDKSWGRGKHPVINITWNDAQEYIVWLSKKTGKSYRLLSEAEWEYVVRAGTSTPFYLGEQITSSDANANFRGYSKYNGSPRGTYLKRTLPVGNFDANEFGLYDLHGNVGEWVQDCYNENYKNAPTDGSAWMTGDCSHRIVRGGSWLFVPEFHRSSYRDRFWRGSRYDYVGFRIARSP